MEPSTSDQQTVSIDTKEFCNLTRNNELIAPCTDFESFHSCAFSTPLKNDEVSKTQTFDVACMEDIENRDKGFCKVIEKCICDVSIFPPESEDAKVRKGFRTTKYTHRFECICKTTSNRSHKGGNCRCLGNSRRICDSYYLDSYKTFDSDCAYVNDLLTSVESKISCDSETGTDMVNNNSPVSSDILSPIQNTSDGHIDFTLFFSEDQNKSSVTTSSLIRNDDLLTAEGTLISSNTTTSNDTPKKKESKKNSHKDSGSSKHKHKTNKLCDIKALREKNPNLLFPRCAWHLIQRIKDNKTLPAPRNKSITTVDNDVLIILVVIPFIVFYAVLMYIFCRKKKMFKKVKKLIHDTVKDDEIPYKELGEHK